MKRYLLFTGSTYYPSQAWNDYRGSFDTIEAALEKALSIRDDWYQVVDTTTEKIVKEGKS